MRSRPQLRWGTAVLLAVALLATACKGEGGSDADEVLDSANDVADGEPSSVTGPTAFKCSLSARTVEIDATVETSVVFEPDDLDLTVVIEDDLGTKLEWGRDQPATFSYAMEGTRRLAATWLTNEVSDTVPCGEVRVVADGEPIAEEGEGSPEPSATVQPTSEATLEPSATVEPTPEPTPASCPPDHPERRGEQCVGRTEAASRLADPPCDAGFALSDDASHCGRAADWTAAVEPLSECSPGFSGPGCYSASDPDWCFAAAAMKGIGGDGCYIQGGVGPACPAGFTYYGGGSPVDGFLSGSCWMFEELQCRPDGTTVQFGGKCITGCGGFSPEDCARQAATDPAPATCRGEATTLGQSQCVDRIDPRTELYCSGGGQLEGGQCLYFVGLIAGEPPAGGVVEPDDEAPNNALNAFYAAVQQSVPRPESHLCDPDSPVLFNPLDNLVGDLEEVSEPVFGVARAAIVENELRQQFKITITGLEEAQVEREFEEIQLCLEAAAPPDDVDFGPDLGEIFAEALRSTGVDLGSLAQLRDEQLEEHSPTLAELLVDEGEDPDSIAQRVADLAVDIYGLDVATALAAAEALLNEGDAPMLAQDAELPADDAGYRLMAEESEGGLLIVDFELIDPTDELRDAETLSLLFVIDPPINRAAPPWTWPYRRYYRAKCQRSAWVRLHADAGRMSAYLWRTAPDYLRIGSRYASTVWDAHPAGIGHDTGSPASYDVYVKGWLDGSHYEVDGSWEVGWGGGC